MKQAMKAAFPHTIPVLFAYLFIGIAFGVLMQSSGYEWYYAVLMSVIVYAGSMQFVCVTFLDGGVSIISMIIMTLFVNLRHVFYGISMLKKFENCGKLKPYLIFALSDETFSIQVSAQVPKTVEKKWFYFFIALFDQCYWIIGSLIGAILGMILPFSSEGIEFSMTALFIVIFLDQWHKSKSHVPALMALVLSIICLFIFGKNNFLLPSMLLILCSMLMYLRFNREDSL